MAACELIFDLHTSNEEFHKKAKKEIEANGGEFHFNDLQVGFIIKLPLGQQIKGRYHLEANKVYVTIDEKPFLINCGMIENTLREKLAG